MNSTPTQPSQTDEDVRTNVRSTAHRQLDIVGKAADERCTKFDDDGRRRRVSYRPPSATMEADDDQDGPPSSSSVVGSATHYESLDSLERKRSTTTATSTAPDDANDAPTTTATIPPPRPRLSRKGSMFFQPNLLGDDSYDAEEEGYKATTLELFSDLVVVVAIHIVAELLEEEVWTDQIVWYLLSVFQLWFVWHVAMITFHVSHLFKDATNPTHYCVVLVWMVGVLMLAQAQATLHKKEALIILIFIRILEIAVFYLQTRRDPPENFDPVRLVILRSIPTTMVPGVVAGEVVPLSLAVFFASDDGTPCMPLLYFSVLAVIAQRTYGAYKGDKAQRQMSQAEKVVIFDDGLMMERYELVNIIFIGEIAFASTAGPNDLLPSLTLATFSIILAFGCYLLSFTVGAHHSEKFWSQSGLIIITGQHFYAMMFIVIPGIAAGLLEIGESFDEELDDGDDNGVDGIMMCSVESVWLLSISTALFLFASGTVHFMSVEGDANYHLSYMQRVASRLFLAALSLAVMFLPPSAACLGRMPTAAVCCTLFLLLAACIEIWGVQYQGSSFWDVPKAMMHVTSIATVCSRDHIETSNKTTLRSNFR